MRWTKSRETILVLMAAALIWFRFRHGGWWALGATGILGVCFFILPAAHLIHRLWMGLGHLLGAVVSRILLTVIYFLILFPLGVLSRLSGKNSLLQRYTGGSCFQSKEHTYTKDDLEHPW